MVINWVLVILLVTVMGKVSIFNPEALKAAVGAKPDGEIVASMANFGHINYGDSIVSSSQIVVMLTFDLFYRT